MTDEEKYVYLVHYIEDDCEYTSNHLETYDTLEDATERAIGMQAAGKRYEIFDSLYKAKEIDVDVSDQELERLRQENAVYEKERKEKKMEKFKRENIRREKEDLARLKEKYEK